MSYYDNIKQNDGVSFLKKNQPNLIVNKPNCNCLGSNNAIRKTLIVPAGDLNQTLMLDSKSPTEERFYSFSLKNRLLPEDKIIGVEVNPAGDSNVTADQITLSETGQDFEVRLNGGQVNQNIAVMFQAKTQKGEVLDFVCTLPIRPQGLLAKEGNIIMVMGASSGEKGKIDLSANVATKAVPIATVEQTVNKTFETRSFVLPNRPIEIIMHKGGATDIIENNVFNAINSYNAYKEVSFEFDIQSCATAGQYIIWHNPKTDTMLDKNIDVQTSTYDELRALRFTGLKNTPYYDYVKLSTLDEWCQFIAKVNRPFYPEIKRFQSLDQVTEIVKTVQKYGLSHLATFENGAYAVLEHVRSLDAKCRVGYIQFGEDNDIDSCIKKMQTLGNGVLLWSITSVKQDPSIVQKCIDGDVGLGMWTASDDKTFLQALQLGGTSITCNHYPVSVV